MNLVFVNPRVDLLHPAFFSRNRDDLRSPDPDSTSGLVRRAKVWWKQWTARRSHLAAGL